MSPQDTLFPFETFNKERTTHLVDDECGNRIILPKYGCLTWIEDMTINHYFVNNGDVDGKPKIGMVEAETELVAKLMQMRAGKKPDEFKPKEEVLLLPSGHPFPSSLVHAIYVYFNEKERGGWKDANEVPPSPTQVEEQAKANAEKKK